MKATAQATMSARRTRRVRASSSVKLVSVISLSLLAKHQRGRPLPGRVEAQTGCCVEQV